MHPARWLFRSCRYAVGSVAWWVGGLVRLVRESRVVSASKSQTLSHPCPITQTELRGKDNRLRQLRAAIKALEGKLAELLRDKTDLCACSEQSRGSSVCSPFARLQAA